jgi:hypothetical protein
MTPIMEQSNSKCNELNEVYSEDDNEESNDNYIYTKTYSGQNIRIIELYGYDLRSGFVDLFVNLETKNMICH